jgi:NADH:ubiquinone reductase (H+-translocating)
MARSKSSHKVVIVGGGFGGIRAALDLAKSGQEGISVTLISDRPHFEYYPTLYRVVTGYSPAQCVIPYKEIFRKLPIDFIQDQVVKIDLTVKTLFGGASCPYQYDSLILAVGSETGYFNISGLAELSYGFKSIGEAERLKAHLTEVMTPTEGQTPEQKVSAAHFVIVGGGPTGVELAGELASYAKHLANKKGFDQSFITVSLIEATPRLLPVMPEDISKKVEEYLHSQGVNIYVNRTVTKQEVEEIFLKDMTVKSRTVVWTAGVKVNALISKIEGFELDRRGKIVVDNQMRAKGHTSVYVVGDIASMPFAGMAQTADHDGSYVSSAIISKLRGKKVKKREQHKPIYAIPAGRHWAVVLWGDMRVTGLTAYIMRKMADLKYLMSILPFWKALSVFRRVFVRSDLP